MSSHGSASRSWAKNASQAISESSRARRTSARSASRDEVSCDRVCDVGAARLSIAGLLSCQGDDLYHQQYLLYPKRIARVKHKLCVWRDKSARIEEELSRRGGYDRQPHIRAAGSAS